MTDFDSVLATLTGIFQRVFGDKVTTLDIADTSKTIAGWDSFRYVEVIVEIETQFGIRLDGPEIDEIETVGDFIALIQAKKKNLSR